MTRISSNLTRKQEEAIIALLTHRGVDEAAKAADVATRTLYRWMKDPEFDAAYRVGLADRVRHSLTYTMQCSGLAR